MKKVLTKSLSILTVLALMFSYNVALAIPETEAPIIVEAGDEFPEIFVNMNHGYCISLLAGESYNFMGTVGAIDAEDGNITESVIVDFSAVKFGVPGDYEVVYSVIDSAENKTVVIKTFTVGECHEVPEIEEIATDEKVLGLTDAIVVQEESCPVVRARVNFSEFADGAEADGWKNWGVGDMEPQTFVGGSNPENIYADEDWFALTDADGNFLDDDDVSGYSNVPGVAIERLDGKLRLVLYGYHDEESGNLGSKEYASGVIELEGATWDTMQSPLLWNNYNDNPRTHDPLINDSVNPMESRGDFVGAIDQHDHRFDRMRTISPTKVAFTLVVTAGADGFYATYDIDEDCDDGENPCEGDCPPPPCEVDCNPPVIILGCTDDSALNFNSEATEDDGSCEYPDQVTDDSDGGGSSGGSSGSRQSSGGGNGGGEVLGATTMCSWDVNTYMRRGYKNDPAQVMILQRDLLNGYMNAGVAVDGIYGPSTEAAVMAFQIAKQDKVLRPWFNLFRPTGIFYKTTLVEAKNTICPEEILPIPTDLIDWSKNPGEVPAKI